MREMTFAEEVAAWTPTGVPETAPVKTHDDQKCVKVLMRGYRVRCECVASSGRITPQECNGLVVFDPQGNQVSTFKGKHYSAYGDSSGGISIYSSHWRHKIVHTPTEETCQPK